MTRQRKSWTEDEARAVLELWQDSGESGAAFARSIGVFPQRLFWWRRQLDAAGKIHHSVTREASAKTSLVPVTVSGVAAPIVLAPPVVVTTRSGARLEVHEVDAVTAAWVAAVLRAEERP